MFNKFVTAFAITGACVWALLTPALAGAQGLGDRDAKEVADYVLTDAGLAKYTQAVHKLQPVKEQLPQDCEGDEQTKSLNDLVARLDGVPAVKSAMKGAGMTSREYLLFAFSVFQNGMAVWALDQPGGTLPPGTKPANITFYRAHKAELEKLGELSKLAECDNSSQ